VTTAIVCYAAIAIRGQEKHLILKGIGRKRPTVTEDYRLSRAPVFIVDLRPIFRSNRAHIRTSFFGVMATFWSEEKFIVLD
jgi:hypothetical protein